MAELGLCGVIAYLQTERFRKCFSFFSNSGDVMQEM